MAIGPRYASIIMVSFVPTVMRGIATLVVNIRQRKCLQLRRRCTRLFRLFFVLGQSAPGRALDRWESRPMRGSRAVHPLDVVSFLGGTPVAAASYMGVCETYKNRYADLAGWQAHLTNSPRRRWRYADSRVGEHHPIAAGEVAAVCLVGRS